MYATLDISTSGMVAQRIRMEVISANIANRDAILDSEGKVNPWRRREVLFAPGDPSASSEWGQSLGVHVASIEVNQGPPRLRWDPNSPYAYKDGDQAGYVPMPDVDSTIEQINGMEALRAYEANVVAAEGTKQMISQTLRLIA